MKIIKRQWTQAGSKLRQNPTKGKPNESSLLIELDQSEKSKTQIPRPIPPTRPKPTLLHQVKNSQTSLNLGQTQILRPVALLKYFGPYNRLVPSHVWMMFPRIFDVPWLMTSIDMSYNNKGWSKSFQEERDW